MQGPEAVLSTVRVPTRTINQLIVVTVYLEVIIIAMKGFISFLGSGLNAVTMNCWQLTITQEDF